MAVRTTTAILYASTALSGPTRLTEHSVYAAAGFAGDIRITAQTAYISTGIAGNQRITSHNVYGAFSLHSLILFSLFNGAQFFGIDSWDLEPVEFIVPEINPYRPTIPEELSGISREFYDFYREDQEIKRQQHNITQAGDSTYPYQLILKSHNIQQFRLGAVGRFYHEDFGILKGRYVKFVNMIQTRTAAGPVGLSKNKDSVNWEVTNDYSLSHPDLVTGILQMPAVPEDDTFGWILTHGANPMEVENDSTTHILGEPFSWCGDGFVGNDCAGRILGRRQARSTSTRLFPGQLLVDFESFSSEQITEIITDSLSSIEQSITDILTSIEDLQDLTSLSGQIDSLNDQIAILEGKLALEETRRIAYDDALNRRLDNLDFPTEQEVDAKIANVSVLLQQLDDRLSIQIAANKLRIDQLEIDLAALEVTDLTEVMNLIEAINERLNKLDNGVKGILPMVDGSVPPVLVYLDDGSLVYAEVDE